MAAPGITQNLQVLGKYRITQVLGFNGLVATFKAFEPESQLPILIVAAAQANLGSAAPFKKFTDEVRSYINAPASRLCAPIAFGEDSGHYWAAYEWLHGSHLGVEVRDKGLPDPALAFQWMSELADALATLHRKGASHRIISPASIFINKMGQVKLLHACWGNVILGIKGGLQNTSFNCILPFSAPEIAAGKPGEETSDVYAIGANLYFLLAGAPPFWHDDSKILASQIQNDAPDLEPLRQLIPANAVDLVEELLHKDPEDRPINMPALSDRLMSIATELIEIQRLNQEVAESEAGHQPDAYEQTVMMEQQPQATVIAPSPHAEPSPKSRPPMPPASGPSNPAAAIAALKSAPPGPPPPSTPITPKPVGKPSGSGDSKRLLVMAVAGAVAVGAAAIVAVLFFMGVFNPAPPPAPKKPVKPKGTPALDVRQQYAETNGRLRRMGQLAMGYFKSNGDWPASVGIMESMGAAPTDFKDSWGHSLEMRAAFVMSAGADGAMDTEDDVWYDAELQRPDGYEPPAPDAPEEPAEENKEAPTPAK